MSMFQSSHTFVRILQAVLKPKQWSQSFTLDPWKMNEDPFPRWEVARQNGPCPELCRTVVSFSPHTYLIRQIVYYASFTIKRTETWRAKLPVQGHAWVSKPRSEDEHKLPDNLTPELSLQTIPLYYLQISLPFYPYYDK